MVEGACFTAANDAAYAFISLAKDMLEHMEDREHAHSAALALTRKHETLISTLGQDLQLAVSRHHAQNARLALLETAEQEIQALLARPQENLKNELRRLCETLSQNEKIDARPALSDSKHQEPSLDL